MKPDQSIAVGHNELANCNIPEARDETHGNPGAPRRNAHGDLTGQTIGYWVVKGVAPYHVSPCGDKVKMWHCECRCGYKAQVRGKSLTQGISHSCGCYARTLRREKEYQGLDLAGEQFGRWFVLQRSGRRVSDTGAVEQQWLCRCSCGTEKIVLGKSLRQGKSRSCGCLRREVLPEARRLARLRRQVAADAAF